MHYAISLKVLGSRPNELNDLSLYLILLAAEFTQPLTQMSIRDRNKYSYWEQSVARA
jgi:hypothetical protein